MVAYSAVTGSTCEYVTTFSNTLYCSPYTTTSMQIIFNATHTILLFALSTVNPAFSIIWKNTTDLGASPIDCSSLGSVVLPYFSDGGIPACVPAGTTVTVTN